MNPVVNITPYQFVSKWSQVTQTESAVSQSHFLDVCALIGHPAPLGMDPKGEFFKFEAKTVKPGGSKGWADVYFLDKFILEYKGSHANLQKAYEQLLLYKEFLGNPPLLITSDTQKIVIHTNFVNTVQETYEVTFANISDGDGIALLKRVFNDPLSFKPKTTKEYVTNATADTFVSVAETLHKWMDATKTKEKPERVAHFLV